MNRHESRARDFTPIINIGFKRDTRCCRSEKDLNTIRQSENLLMARSTGRGFE